MRLLILTPQGFLIENTFFKTLLTFMDPFWEPPCCFFFTFCVFDVSFFRAGTNPHRCNLGLNVVVYMALARDCVLPIVLRGRPCMA